MIDSNTDEGDSDRDGRQTDAGAPEFSCLPSDKSESRRTWDGVTRREFVTTVGVATGSVALNGPRRNQCAGPRRIRTTLSRSS
jgi:hypothetical protein